MYVRVKRVGSRRYAYLVKGVREKERVRQKTLCYLGPVAKLGFGIPDDIRRRVEQRFQVNWDEIENGIRQIPLTLEEISQLRREILKRIGFEREGMIWLNKTLGLAIHIVGLFAKNSEKARIIHAGPYLVRIVGVEDLIIDRLAAAKFWNSQVDLEQAMALWRGFRKQIDLQYLRKRARDEKVEDVLP